MMTDREFANLIEAHKKLSAALRLIPPGEEHGPNIAEAEFTFRNRIKGERERRLEAARK